MPATDEKDIPGIVEKTRRFASRRSDEKRRLKTRFAPRRRHVRYDPRAN